MHGECWECEISPEAFGVQVQQPAGLGNEARTHAAGDGSRGSGVPMLGLVKTKVKGGDMAIWVTRAFSARGSRGSWQPGKGYRARGE